MMEGTDRSNYRRAEVDWSRWESEFVRFCLEKVTDDLCCFPRYGLGNEEESHQYQRGRPRGNSGGFVDLGNEYQYGAGGHQASGANEIFAEEQGDRPWYVYLAAVVTWARLRFA